MSSNATPSLFGWDFQINAAIILFLDNISNVEYMRLEGATEDIEIKLDDGKFIYAQAKSVIDPHDYTHVKNKLQEALTTLNEASKIDNCKSIIYTTNSPNPFSNKFTMSSFYGLSRVSFENLPSQCKKTIETEITKFRDLSFDTGKFSMLVFPFHSDNLIERYKVIKTSIDDLLSDLGRLTSGKSNCIMETWQREIFQNGTKKNIEVVLKKSELIWPIISVITECRYDHELLLEMDACEVEEIIFTYPELINSKIDRFEFATKIVFDYNEFDHTPAKTKSAKFIEERWIDYKDEFNSICIDDELKEKLLKIIISNILSTRFVINSVKKKVNL